MTKLRCPLSVHGVIQAAYDEAGGLDAVQVTLPHRSTRWLYAATDPDVEERRKAMLTLDDVRALTASGVKAFVHDLARIAGMYAQPIAREGDMPVADLFGLAAKLMKEGGEAVAAVIEAHADGVITPVEAANLKRELLEVSAVVHQLLTQIDSGGAG